MALSSPARSPRRTIRITCSGNAPVFCPCDDRDSYRAALARAVRESAQAEGLTAIICAGTRSMEKTAALLGDDQIPVLRAGDSLPESGVFFITLAHAKGLEFDGVIIPDAGADTYTDTLLSRHRLYTALSRATRRLTALSCGTMTPLLP